MRGLVSLAGSLASAFLREEGLSLEPEADLTLLEFLDFWSCAFLAITCFLEFLIFLLLSDPSSLTCSLWVCAGLLVVAVLFLAADDFLTPEVL